MRGPSAPAGTAEMILPKALAGGARVRPVGFRLDVLRCIYRDCVRLARGWCPLRDDNDGLIGLDLSDLVKNLCAACFRGIDTLQQTKVDLAKISALEGIILASGIQASRRWKSSGINITNSVFSDQRNDHSWRRWRHKFETGISQESSA